MLTMNQMSPGQRGIVQKVLNTGSMRRRLMDIGLIEGARIECVGRSPGGDPTAYLIRGAVITIREEDGCGVLIE